MSILELARIVTAPDNLDQLHKVTQLHAIEREMMLGRLKRNALVRLAELTEEVPAASADEDRAAEVMRKACVDILKFGNGRENTERRYSGSGGRGDHREPLSPASEAEILEALETWGQEEEEHHRHHDFVQDGGQAPTTQIEDSPGRIAQIRRGENGNEYEDKYEPRAQTSGAGVRDVNLTHDAQVGMAFGKTSDHSTGTGTGGTPEPPPSHRGNTSSDTRSTPAGIPSTEGRQRKPHNEILLDEAHPP